MECGQDIFGFPRCSGKNISKQFAIYCLNRILHDSALLEQTDFPPFRGLRPFALFCGMTKAAYKELASHSFVPIPISQPW